GRVRATAAAAGAPLERVVMFGLANGFVQYVATRDEYRAQHYEGASTLYGPGTAAALGDALAALTRSLGTATAPSPPAEVDALTVRPGSPRRVLPAAAEPRAVTRRIVRLACGGDGIRAEWEDAAPGALDVSAQLLVRVERLHDTGADTVAWDDGPIEVRSLGRARGSAWRWGMWWPGNAPGRYRVVLAARPGVAELAADCP
ncbi:MAG: neutral/alkaline non-lysosomal ceramidase N-terminal domain-containing protein, partial [Gemmatimonadales bacterium]